MVLDDTIEEDNVWDDVFARLHFKPDSTLRTHSFACHLPFEISEPFAVYSIEGMTDAQIDSMTAIIKGIFINITTEGDRLYALDWEHSSFLYDPRNDEEQKDVWIEDDHYFGGGYNANFPPFFPDADYYFFIDEQFRFGYLGHPWRQEVWLFGEALLAQFEQCYHQLGWIKLK